MDGRVSFAMPPRMFACTNRFFGIVKIGDREQVAIGFVRVARQAVGCDGRGAC
jgi:hypothetical protein